MGKNTAILLIFSAFIAVNVLHSQPKATFQLVGGYSIPLPDYAGTFGETRDQFTGNGNPDSNTYFMKNGTNYGLIVKIPINRKTLPLNVSGSILINGLSQTKDYTTDTSFISVDLSQTITSFGAGIEYSFSGKKTIFNPSIMLQFTLNLYSGQYTEYDGINTTTLNLFNTIRGGIQASAGFDYVLHNNVGICAGLRYSYSNIFGKSSGKDTQTKYYLNDGEREDQGSIYPERKITYLQIFGGVSFYFGR